MEKFHNMLNRLKQDVYSMGSLACEILEDSIESLINLDIELAEKTHAKKDTLMKYDNEIEGKALKMIAQYQPMAIDMRTLACILKSTVKLTRIGRYGKDIANIVRKELDGKRHIKKIVLIKQMTEVAVKMVQDCLKAFDQEELEPIKEMGPRDDVVDDYRMSIFRECLTYMMENAQNIPVCIAYIMTSRYLERCGDHACDISEMVHYMITGKRIEIK
ncbi:MAG: phosphate signaling complex protein PhoU [Candidatus Lokiarchaeota archaeon]|nr:phosphate signaling complex protein PhoU [Candidatus Lokiarchaeota archaeon]